MSGDTADIRMIVLEYSAHLADKLERIKTLAIEVGAKAITPERFAARVIEILGEKIPDRVAKFLEESRK